MSSAVKMTLTTACVFIRSSDRERRKAKRKEPKLAVDPSLDADESPIRSKFRPSAERLLTGVSAQVKGRET